MSNSLHDCEFDDWDGGHDDDDDDDDNAGGGGVSGFSHTEEPVPSTGGGESPLVMSLDESGDGQGKRQRKQAMVLRVCAEETPCVVQTHAQEDSFSPNVGCGGHVAPPSESDAEGPPLCGSSTEGRKSLAEGGATDVCAKCPGSPGSGTCKPRQCTSSQLQTAINAMCDQVRIGRGEAVARHTHAPPPSRDTGETLSLPSSPPTLLSCPLGLSRSTSVFTDRLHAQKAGKGNYTRSHSCLEKMEEREYFDKKFSLNMHAYSTPLGAWISAPKEGDQAGQALERQERGQRSRSGSRRRKEAGNRTCRRSLERSFPLQIKLPQSPSAVYVPFGGDGHDKASCQRNKYYGSGSTSGGDDDDDDIGGGGGGGSRSSGNGRAHRSFLTSTASAFCKNPYNLPLPCLNGSSDGDDDTNDDDNALRGASNNNAGSVSCDARRCRAGIRPLVTQSDVLRAKNWHLQASGRAGDVGGFPSQNFDATPPSGFFAAEVLPGFFLGSYTDASNLEALAAHGISLVLNLTEECCMTKQMRSNPYHIVFAQFPLKDHSDENIARYFDPLSRMIHMQLHRRQRALQSLVETTSNASPLSPSALLAASSESLLHSGMGGVLVHCRMGVSRSATIVLAYLMIYGDKLSTDTCCCSSSSSSTQKDSDTFLSATSSASFRGSDAWNACSLSSKKSDDSSDSCNNKDSASSSSNSNSNNNNNNNNKRSTDDDGCTCCCCVAKRNRQRALSNDSGGMPTVVKSYRAAFELVKKRKSDINPNIGFVLALRDLDDEQRTPL